VLGDELSIDLDGLVEVAEGFLGVVLQRQIFTTETRRHGENGVMG
jgi:hypothetical protein